MMENRDFSKELDYRQSVIDFMVRAPHRLVEVAMIHIIGDYQNFHVFHTFIMSFIGDILTSSKWIPAGPSGGIFYYYL